MSFLTALLLKIQFNLMSLSGLFLFAAVGNADFEMQAVPQEVAPQIQPLKEQKAIPVPEIEVVPEKAQKQEDTPQQTEAE